MSTEQTESSLPETTAPQKTAPQKTAPQKTAPEGTAPEADAKPDADGNSAERRQIEEQLAELERKQSELRRALAIANHPTLADAIREIEGRAYGVSRVETRLAEPLSKPEQRQRAKLEKKIQSLQDKRRALDAQIEELEAQLAPLTHERVDGLRAEHEDALRALFAVLATHSNALDEAGLQAASLVPELERWLPQLRSMAEVAET